MFEFGIIVLWYVLSFVYFYSIFGEKFRKDKWFDFLWVIPVFSIIFFILFIDKIVELLQPKEQQE